MDTDHYTSGQCKHGNFYDNCATCEAAFERLRAVARIADVGCEHCKPIKTPSKSPGNPNPSTLKPDA